MVALSANTVDFKRLLTESSEKFRLIPTKTDKAVVSFALMYVVEDEVIEHLVKCFKMLMAHPAFVEQLLLQEFCLFRFDYFHRFFHVMRLIGSSLIVDIQ